MITQHDLSPRFFRIDAMLLCYVMLFYYVMSRGLSLFTKLMLVVTGAMHETESAYSIQSTWLCY